jgi:hypothetical protein
MVITWPAHRNRSASLGKQIMNRKHPGGDPMPDVLILLIDLVAINVLVFGVYYRRHYRRDMLLAFIGLNVGVLAVSAVLAGVAVGVGVGLGLFGVLSIVRLRSSEISQQEVAYFFASLALGLICGLQPDPRWLAPALCALIVVTFAIVDYPRFHAGYRQQLVTVDAVFSTEDALMQRLEELLNAKVQRIVVNHTDLVRDMTLVDVRYRTLPSPNVRKEHVDLTRLTAATSSAPTPPAPLGAGHIARRASLAALDG